jgi:hypothetical protein
MGQPTPDKVDKKEKNPQPCDECGARGEYCVDAFGIPSDTWRCVECHEQACRRKIRHDMWDRYGYRFADQ